MHGLPYGQYSERELVTVGRLTKFAVLDSRNSSFTSASTGAVWGCCTAVATYSTSFPLYSGKADSRLATSPQLCH